MTVLAEPSTRLIVKPCWCCTLLRRAILVLLGLTAVLGIAAWCVYEPVLRVAADWWVISDPLAPADAAAVLGGGLDSRPFAVAAYYHQGLVKKVLLPDIAASPAERLGVLLPHAEANRRVLIKLGVRESDIETFGTTVSNTYEEAVALRQWAERTGSRSIIVPTEIFSTRRVRWTLRRALGEGVTVRVTALEPLDYRRQEWWRSAAGLLGFQNEIIKHAYYRLKY